MQAESEREARLIRRFVARSVNAAGSTLRSGGRVFERLEEKGTHPDVAKIYPGIDRAEVEGDLQRRPR